MKLLFISLLMLIFGELAFSQSMLPMKVGDKATFDGVLISKQDLIFYVKTVDELSSDKAILKQKDLIISEYMENIRHYKFISDEKDLQIAYLEKKVSNLSSYIESSEKRLGEERLKVKILSVVSAIGWGIAFGETTGILAFVGFKYSLNL